MNVQTIIQKINESYERLNQREKLIVTIGGIVSGFLILLIGWLLLAQNIDTIELRSGVKKKQLSELTRLQSTYNSRESTTKSLQRRLQRNKIRIVQHVETAAKKAGVEIGNMTPRESSPDPNGIQETSVEIRLQKLSITRLQKFLEYIENTQNGIVKIKRLRMRKRYDDKTLLDVDLSISTYKMS